MAISGKISVFILYYIYVYIAGKKYIYTQIHASYSYTCIYVTITLNKVNITLTLPNIGYIKIFPVVSETYDCRL